MKKIVIYLLFLLSGLPVKAQLINSVGITGGVSYGNQKFLFRDPTSISRKKYMLGYNGSIFAECFNNDFARWVTEIQYNQKGSVDKQSTGNYSNKLHYLSWNNYLKLRYEMYSIIPYIMFGPRLEYNLIQATSSPAITGKFLPLHLSAAFGGGTEFVSFTNLKFFVEAFYNPDMMPAYIRPELHVKNKNFELRLGLKYEFKEQKESCNAPTYVE